LSFLPELDVPEIEVTHQNDGYYQLTCRPSFPGEGYALMGVLRAMADDYGALVMLEHGGWKDTGEEQITINVLEMSFSDGRDFALSAGLA